MTAAAKAAHTREWKLRGKIESDFITSIGTRGTVYRTRDWERLAAALDELERRHVVSAEWRAGTRWYELAHDRLIDPIRTSNERFRARTRRRWTLISAVVVAIAVAVAAGITAYFVLGPNLSPAPSSKLLATATTGGDILAASSIGNGTGIETIDRSGKVQVSRVGSSALSFQAGNGPFTAAAFTSGGSRLLVARGSSVEEWDPATAKPLRTFPAPTGVHNALAITSPVVGRVVAIGAGPVVTTLATHFQSSCGLKAEVTSLALDADGGRVAMRLAPGFGAVCGQSVGQQAKYFHAGNAHVDAVALSPDGKWLAAACDDGTVRVWSVATRKTAAKVPISSKAVETVAFSPDGQLIAAGGKDTAVHVFRWRPFQGAIALPGHKGTVTSVSFTPNGNELISTGKDNTARIWGYFGAAARIRDRIVEAALAGVANNAKIHYAQTRPMPDVGTVRLPDVPTEADSGGFVTWCYWQAGAPDPNGLKFNGQGYTGTMLQHMRHIPQSAVRPGDLVVFGPPPGHHVALVVSAGKNPLLASHGQEAGPSLIRFSDESKFQPPGVTWLKEGPG